MELLAGWGSGCHLECGRGSSKSFKSTGRNPVAQLEHTEAKNQGMTTDCYMLVLSSQEEKRTARQLRGLLWWGMQGPRAAGVGRWGVKWLHYTKKYHYSIWHRSRLAPRCLFQLMALLTKLENHTLIQSILNYSLQSSVCLKVLESSSY